MQAEHPHPEPLPQASQPVSTPPGPPLAIPAPHAAPQPLLPASAAADGGATRRTMQGAPPRPEPLSPAPQPVSARPGLPPAIPAPRATPQPLSPVPAAV